MKDDALADNDLKQISQGQIQNWIYDWQSYIKRSAVKRV